MSSQRNSNTAWTSSCRKEDEAMSGEKRIESGVYLPAPSLKPRKETVTLEHCRIDVIGGVPLL
jgi:hypothetical protein